MMNYQKAAASIQKLSGPNLPDVGVVLGSGLGQIANSIKSAADVSYNELPGFPMTTVSGHEGRLRIGTWGGAQVACLQGRFHFYEGHSMQEITFPIRVMKMLGIQTLLLSNAAGGVNLQYRKGDLVIIEDHINLQPFNPLTGPNLEVLGPRFPDMSEPYKKDLIAKLKEIAGRQMVPVREGVYASVTGPNLETRAEYRYLKIIGADMVGMSTVPEVIIANHMNLPCLAVSVITDECDPDNLQPVNIEEIIAVAGEADDKLSNLFVELMDSL